MQIFDFEIAKVLRRRKALAAEAAEALLSDNDARIRLEAINALTEQGRKFSEQEARRILVKPKSVGVFGLGGDYDAPGNNALEQFRIAQMMSMSETELNALVQLHRCTMRVRILLAPTNTLISTVMNCAQTLEMVFKKYFDQTLERMTGERLDARANSKGEVAGGFHGARNLLERRWIL